MATTWSMREMTPDPLSAPVELPRFDAELILECHRRTMEAMVDLHCATLSWLMREPVEVIDEGE